MSINERIPRALDDSIGWSPFAAAAGATPAEAAAIAANTAAIGVNSGLIAANTAAIAAVGQMFSVTRALTQAEIATLLTTPITLVTPAAGVSLIPYRFIFEIVIVGAGYGVTPEIRVRYAGSTVAVVAGSTTSWGAVGTKTILSNAPTALNTPGFVYAGTAVQVSASANPGVPGGTATGTITMQFGAF